MSRWVVPQKAGLVGAGGTSGSDGKVDRIAKYVPAEIISAYTCFYGLIVALEQPPNLGFPVTVGMIVLFCLVTVGYVYRNTTGAVRSAHLLVSPLAFLAWAYPISSALLAGWFYGIASVIAQAIVVGLAIVVVPKES